MQIYGCVCHIYNDGIWHVRFQLLLILINNRETDAPSASCLFKLLHFVTGKLNPLQFVFIFWSKTFLSIAFTCKPAFPSANTSATSFYSISINNRSLEQSCGYLQCEWRWWLCKEIVFRLKNVTLSSTRGRTEDERDISQHYLTDVMTTYDKPTGVITTYHKLTGVMTTYHFNKLDWF